MKVRWVEFYQECVLHTKIVRYVICIIQGYIEGLIGDREREVGIVVERVTDRGGAPPCQKR